MFEVLLYSQHRIAFGAQRHTRDRMYDSQKTIKRHQHQRVDTAMTGDDNHVLHKFAPQVAEWPLGQHVISCRKGHTKDDEEYIRNR